MRAALLILFLAMPLGGCALLAEGIGFAEAGIGLAARGAAAEAGFGLAARGAAAEAGFGTIATSDAIAARAVLVADDLLSAGNGLKVGASAEGSLTQAFSEWTSSGTATGRLYLSDAGILRANGYPIARLVPETGDLIAGNGRRLGYLNAREGAIYEYKPSGESYELARFVGKTNAGNIALYSTEGGNVVTRILSSDNIFSVSRISPRRYLIRLVNGSSGWIDRNAGFDLALLAVTQKSSRCQPDRSGMAVLSTGQSIRYSRCSDRGDAIALEGSTSNILPKARIAYMLSGDLFSEVSSYRTSGENPRLTVNSEHRIVIPPAEAFVHHPVGQGVPGSTSVDLLPGLTHRGT